MLRLQQEVGLRHFGLRRLLQGKEEQHEASLRLSSCTLVAWRTRQHDARRNFDALLRLPIFNINLLTNATCTQ